MNIQDPIADMLTRIKNAYKANHKTVEIPCSRSKAAVAEILKDEGYLKNVSLEGKEKNKKIKIVLKYYNKKPVIEGLDKVSKPSCRRYCSCTEIPRVRNGMGTVILSTSSGIVSDRTAKQKNTGGEILCEVW